MKVLITGSSGFTGQAFARACQAIGHTVVFLQSNLEDKDSLTVELQNTDVDAVVHLAAISFVGHSDNSAFYSVNTIGTENLLQGLAGRAGRLKAVLLASSANVYGNNPNSPLCEDEKPNPVNHYAASKLAMEYIGLTYADRLPLFITRPFNYTGPGQAQKFLIPKLVHHFSNKDQLIQLGNLYVEREFNDIDFICQAYLGLLEFGNVGQIYNICSGITHTLNDVLGSLKNLTGHTINVEVNPILVRQNEVHRLCGNPAKLKELFERNGAQLHNPPLTLTLKKMLDDRQRVFSSPA